MFTPILHNITVIIICIRYAIWVVCITKISIENEQHHLPVGGSQLLSQKVREFRSNFKWVNLQVKEN